MPDPAARPQPWHERAALLAGLAAMLAAMFASHGAVGLHGSSLHVLMALIVASASWLAWVLAGPRGDSWVLRILTVCTALSGSVLLLLYPSLAVYWFTFWACFNAGASFPTRVGATVTGASAAVLLAGYAAQRATILAAFAAVAFVGYMIGRNRRQYVGLATEATAGADEREREAAQAERERIARELHDVLGHSLTGVSMQIESAAAVLETTADTTRALSHLDNAGRLVRSGQQEAVAAVQTLRDSDGDLDALAWRLVTGYRAAGVSAELTVTGSPRSLDSERTLALYRVLQEALTNAAKHAPGQPVEAVLGYGSATVSICVANETGAGVAVVSGGHGLAGMRERMTAVGGTVTAGPAGNRWCVEARVGG